MKAIHIEPQTGREIPAHEVGGGVIGFISWHRLLTLFRDANELRQGESIKSFQIDERGLTFRLR